MSLQDVFDVYIGVLLYRDIFEQKSVCFYNFFSILYESSDVARIFVGGRKTVAAPRMP